jgi:parvulin-like peptidyl-prolyl isomerase
MKPHAHAVNPHADRRHSAKRASLVHATALALFVMAAAPYAVQAQGIAIARVNGVSIGRDVVDRRFDEILRDRRLNIARIQDPEKVKTLKREALDDLIGVELLWQDAQRRGIAAEPADVDQALTAEREGFGSREAFVRGIERRGHDEASYRLHVHRMLAADRVAQEVVQLTVRIGEADIAAFYDANPRHFKRPEKVRARHMLVAVAAGAEPSRKRQARQRIEALLQRVRAGEDFEALARQHSEAATRSWGGELDVFGRGEQAKPIEDAAFALEPGAVSRVVETAEGFHIVKLEERISGRSVSLDAARDAIRDYLLRTRGKEAIAAHIQTLRANAQVQVASH